MDLHAAMVGVVGSADGDLEGEGRAVGEGEGGLEGEFVEDGGAGVMARVKGQLDQRGAGQEGGPVDGVVTQPWVAVDA